MGFLDRKLSKMANNIEAGKVDSKRNIIDDASQKTERFIRELSGASLNITKKIPDNIIAFTNASGGCGATTIMSNVAYFASNKGLRVVIVDLNILNPVQHTMLGVEQKVEAADLVSLLLGKNSLADSINTHNKINIIFANNRTIGDKIQCNDRRAIDNFNDMMYHLRSLYDLVLIDIPMQIDDLLCNTAMYTSDAIYMVWDDSAMPIINTDKLRRNMSLTGIDSYTKMRVIINKRTSLHYSDAPLQRMNLELVGVLPFDNAIIESSYDGVIFCEKAASNSKNAKEFESLCYEMTDRILDIAGYVGK